MQKLSTFLILLLHWNITKGKIIDSRIPRSCITYPKTTTGVKKHLAGHYNLRVVVEKWIPLVDVYNSTDGCLHIKGPMAVLLSNSANLLNFSYNIVMSPDRKWGVRFENGTWNGMIGMLHRQEADLGLGPFSANLQRHSVVEYTNPLFMESLAVLLGKKQLKHKKYSFFRTFSWEVWLLVILTVVIVTLTNCFISHVNSSEEQNFNFFMHTLVVTFGCLCTQGLPRLPFSTSGRLLIAFWWIGLVILINGFSGNIKAWLLFRENPDRVDSLQDLLKFPDLVPVIEGGTSTEGLFKTSTDPVYRKIWNQILRYNDSRIRPGDYNRDDFLDKVANGTHALITSEVSIFYSLALRYQRRGDCRFYLSKERFQPKSRVIAIPRNSPYPDLLSNMNYRLAMIMQSGLFAQSLSHELQNYTKCLETTDETSRPMSLEDVGGIFIVLAVGLCVSFLCIALELVYNRAKRNKI